MSRTQQRIDDDELITRYYSTDPKYPCGCYSKGTYWCSECKVLADAAEERQDIRERLKKVLDEVNLSDATEWSWAVAFTHNRWQELYAKIMEAV